MLPASLSHTFGLGGMLHLLDLMMAYLLEMGLKLANANGEDLYSFWGEQITKKPNKALEQPWIIC
jgi:cytoplasmic iron level regulating protein YaaA (DUF328/UPF0246 family)